MNFEVMLIRVSLKIKNHKKILLYNYYVSLMHCHFNKIFLKYAEIVVNGGNIMIFDIEGHSNTYIRFHLAMSTQAVNESFNVRSEYAI